jgi:hypothetical protein
MFTKKNVSLLKEKVKMVGVLQDNISIPLKNRRIPG